MEHIVAASLSLSLRRESALAFGAVIIIAECVLVCFESERNVLILPMMTNVKECRIFLSSLPSHLFEKYNNNRHRAKRAPF
jgi:hypothetical protein